MKSTISHSTAHYLVALENLHDQRGYARAVDVAQQLNISRTAAHLGLKALKARQLVEEDDRHFYSLTEEARALARHLKGTHSVLEMFFTQVLNLDAGEAHENACAIDHHLSPAAARRLLGFLKYLLNHPSGEDLMSKYHGIRAQCSHEGQCELCREYDGCPLGKYMPERTDLDMGSGI